MVIKNNKLEVLNILQSCKVIPVVVLEKIDDTLPKLNALLSGGLNVCEITFRTACARAAIEIATKNLPQMLVGAGTVINAAQCKSAILAGAKFIVSPGFSYSVFKVCKKFDVMYLPGCATPTEIMQALECRLDIVKFFPAQIYGGLAGVKALSGPFPSIKFVPTGGVESDNLQEFLNNSKIFAVGGSWMMKGSLKDIEQQTKQLVKIVKESGK